MFVKYILRDFFCRQSVLMVKMLADNVCCDGEMLADSVCSDREDASRQCMF